MHIAKASIAINTLITFINCELYQNSEINTFEQYHLLGKENYWVLTGNFTNNEYYH